MADLQTVYSFLIQCGTYYIATIDGDKPRVRPFGTAAIFEDKLYIQTSNQKKVFEQIQKNSNVELSAFDGDKWIRVSGKLVRDERTEAKQYILDKHPSLKAMYSADDGKTEVFYFESGTATISSFAGEDEVINF
ncbi:MAG: pyridoxamine 5'-phosphate oxidase family protein [Oscillospiraceae bacterium]|nr:pyridoxamine 5'-phosphate oxidase family protein [Oscillospiraceae bacterium]